MTGAIVKQLRDATPVWVQPVPLRAERDEAAPYPIDALGDDMARAVRAIMARVQVPDSLAAHSVLAAVSLAVQGHALVRLPTQQTRPTSLFLATIADSGDRKTSADQLALAPIADLERELAQRHAMERQAHATHFSLWKAAKDGIAKGGGSKDRAAIDAEVERLGPPPAEPPLPVIIVPPGSTQGIVAVLEKGRPSIGLFINEGGSWLGSWGMQDENRTASISAYSEMWDGQPVKTLTKGDGLRYLPDRAFAFHVMFQRHYTDKLFGDAEMREQGFLSRILAAQPRSLAGSRLHDPDAVEPAQVADDLAAYHEQLARIIRAPLPVDPVDPNGLTHRKSLTFDADATRRFWTFYNHVERQQGEGADLADVRGFAGKAVEQVARIAAVVHVFERGLRDLTITAPDVERAIVLMDFYIREAQRLAHCQPADALTAQAVALSTWLAEKRTGTNVSLRVIRMGSPRAIRGLGTLRLRQLVDLLVSSDHLIPVPTGALVDGRLAARRGGSTSVGEYQPFFPNGWQPAAPEADCCRAVAASVATDGGLPDWGEGADFRRFLRQRGTGGEAVATVATVSTPSLPWSDGLALLQRLSRPDWVTPERWDRLVYQAITLSQAWGEQAHALGWRTVDLFGCNPKPWAGRIDRDGLALTLADWRGPISVRAITADRIALEVDRRQLLHFYRFDRAGSVPLWIGYAQEGGP